jgi:TolB-like protein/DNA-binding winged helix-turn-helix (wHTH) protein/Tfp pilus assembly protein PilF
VSDRKLHFDGWVFDPDSGDLERAGRRTRLQEQPARLLRELIAQGGGVVTRERLIELLWPKGVVDFDAGLNSAIRKLRSALGDLAETPNYIETLPRRGYRFIATLDARTESPPNTWQRPAVVPTPSAPTEAPENPPSDASGAAGRLPTASASTQKPTQTPVRVAICVLPFANLDGDAEQQALGDGISEDIITELSRWRRLEVRPRSASFRHRGVEVDISHAAHAMNVRFVVAGSVRRMGDRIRITAQLVDGLSGHQIWGERFDRAHTEIFAVQDDLVQKIVSTLVGRVQVTDADRARRKPPASLEAYECVQKGNALPWDDPAGAAEATQLFETAIDIDPSYGMAHALLAVMRLREWHMRSGDSPVTLEQAYRFAMRAVELDDGESTCHSILAQVCLYRRAFELAALHMRRAVEVNPNNQWNVADIAYLLVYTGETDEALRWTARAREMDPYFNPPWYWRQVGCVYFVSRKYREALVMYEHIPMRNDRDAALMAACHARLGETERCRSYIAESLMKRPGFSIRQMMAKEPFKLESDARHLEESLRLAGLPE